MALRMMLTAMVVSLSLPMPSMDSCRSLVNEMNRELATALHDAREEWTSGARLESLEADLSQELAKLGDTSAERLAAAATSEEFSRIVDEFVDDVSRTDIELAAKHARTIPLEPVNQPLPPAAEAAEALPSALDLIRSVSEESAAKGVVSESETWNDIVMERRSGTNEGFVEIEFAIPVISADLGPWLWVVDESETDGLGDQVAASLEAAPAVVVIPVDSASEEWDCVIRQISVAGTIAEIDLTTKEIATKSDSVESDESDGKKAGIRDAFRKTAEAIALWSRVISRPS